MACWDFLAVGRFFEEETDESWENRVFSVPEIALVHQELFLSPTSPFSFNVDVAVCEFEAEAIRSSVGCDALFSIHFLKLCLDADLLTRCNFMVILCPFHAFGFHSCPRGNLRRGVEVHRRPAAIWHTKPLPSAHSDIGSLSPFLNDNGCRQEHIVRPECY